MYRMELENREDNFNRMFADKQPVILGQQPDRYLVSILINCTILGEATVDF